MHCSEFHATRSRLSQALGAAALGAGLFLMSGLMSGANAQMTPPQARPQAQSPSPTISDEKINAAAVAIGHVTSIQQNYERKISEAPPSDKQRLTTEANSALQKAVTDQGLSVDEYNSIIRTAQNDPAVRQKLAQRIPHSGQ